MRGLSIKIARLLEMYNIIKENEVDTCRYGLDILISSSLEVISIIILSLFLKNFVQTISFFVAFIPLRIFAGGYHANTKMRCYIISLIVYIFFSCCLNIIHISQCVLTCSVSSIISLVLICLFAPVIHSNKSINSIEIENFKRLSIIICMIQTVTILLFMCISSNTLLFVALPMALGEMAVTFSMVVAVFQKNKKRKEEVI